MTDLAQNSTLMREPDDGAHPHGDSATAESGEKCSAQGAADEQKGTLVRDAHHDQDVASVESRENLTLTRDELRARVLAALDDPALRTNEERWQWVGCEKSCFYKTIRELKARAPSADIAQQDHPERNPIDGNGFDGEPSDYKSAEQDSGQQPVTDDTAETTPGGASREGAPLAHEPDYPSHHTEVQKPESSTGSDSEPLPAPTSPPPADPAQDRPMTMFAAAELLTTEQVSERARAREAARGRYRELLDSDDPADGPEFFAMLEAMGKTVDAAKGDAAARRQVRELSAALLTDERRRELQAERDAKTTAAMDEALKLIHRTVDEFVLRQDKWEHVSRVLGALVELTQNLPAYGLNNPPLCEIRVEVGKILQRGEVAKIEFGIATRQDDERRRQIEDIKQRYPDAF